MTDKEKILAKIESLLNETNYEPYTDEVFGRIESLKELKSYINSLQEVPIIEDLLDMTKIDNKIQYASIDDGIHAYAEDYSFNIESELFNQLTKEQQVLWQKEIEQAAISGGHYGVELARDKRYEENRESVNEELEEAADNALSNVLNTHEIVNVRSCLEMFRFGAKWHKEQMMAKAVDAELYSDGMLTPLIGVKDKEKISNIKFGDKIKLIIIKDE